MDDVELQSTLLVFGLIFYLAAYVAFQTLRARLGAVPHHAAALQQQIETLTADANASEASKLRAEEELQKLRAEVDRATTKLLETKQALHEMQHRLPTVVYVLDQIIQSSYTPFLITVRRDYAPDGATPAVSAEILRGRRMLVFADNPGNVRRRVEARFPPGQGYHTGEPAPFVL